MRAVASLRRASLAAASPSATRARSSAATIRSSARSARAWASVAVLLADATWPFRSTTALSSSATRVEAASRAAVTPSSLASAATLAWPAAWRADSARDSLTMNSSTLRAADRSCSASASRAAPESRPRRRAQSASYVNVVTGAEAAPAVVPAALTAVTRTTYCESGTRPRTVKRSPPTRSPSSATRQAYARTRACSATSTV
mmetsp:Transcript_139178/g.338076  ORF Transcript_139178/g.338076 Transcript_139178/m.338076 type:complete len:202 (-) Transcript_139178:307-912(-)